MCGGFSMSSITEFSGAKSINSWLAHNDLSRPFWYQLKKAGKAPKTFFVGTKELISGEADAEWRRERELESQSENTKRKLEARSARARAARSFGRQKQPTA